MNTRYYLRLLRTLVLAALTAAAAACSDDNDENDGREPLTPPDGNGGIPVTFTANINPGSDADPAAAPGTRTVLKPDGRNGFTVEWKGRDDYANDCDWIRIWAADVQGTLTNSGRSKYYVSTTSAASSALEPRDAGEKLTLSSSGEWKFTAIYGSAMAGPDAVYADIVFLEQSAPGNTDHIAERDFSVATATQTVAANSEMPAVINFKFEHKLSALQLRITNQTGEELTVKEIRLSTAGGEITSRKTYDVAQGNWKTTGEVKDAYLQLTASNFPALATGGASQDLHMLLFPGYENDTLTVTVITSRGEYSRTKPAPDGGFLAAKNYLTDITIKSSGLTDKETWRETIRTAEELAAFRERVNGGNDYSGKTVYLADNIDLADASWTPIGTDENKPFKGTFEGDGYKISNLNVNVGTQNAGLFGYVNGGKVCNLCVSGNVTTTEMYAGGIAGYLYGGTVENCIFDGDVSGAGYVGGIAGWSSDNSRIAGCYTNGSVTATSDYAGGIAGKNEGSTITDCYSKAEVKGSATTGGIAGANNGTSGIITRCYATGQVSGQFLVGGIVGIQYDGTVTGCIALNPGLTRTGGSEVDFGRVGRSGTFTSCAAFEGMTLPYGVTVTSAANGRHGTALSAADCLTPAAYTSRNFTEATATTPGWAFSAATPWTYLPWNPAFASFPGITDPAQYRIAVPAYLSSSGGTN